MINKRYPGGVEAQKKILEKEGHTVLQKGKKFIVENLEKKKEEKQQLKRRENETVSLFADRSVGSDDLCLC